MFMYADLEVFVDNNIRELFHDEIVVYIRCNSRQLLFMDNAWSWVLNKNLIIL